MPAPIRMVQMVKMTADGPMKSTIASVSLLNGSARTGTKSPPSLGLVRVLRFVHMLKSSSEK